MLCIALTAPLCPLQAFQADSGVAIPPGTWTQVLTHGLPVEANGWEQLIYVPPLKQSIMLSQYHQRNSEPNESIVGYNFDTNAWSIIDMGGNFHTESIPEGGESQGYFGFDPTSGMIVYHCCTSGSNQPEDINHDWWYDVLGQSGRDKHTSPKPPAGVLLPGGTFDIAHNVFVFEGGASFVGTWAYNPVSNTWQQMSPGGTVPDPSLALPGLAYSTAEQKIYLFGGQSENSSAYNNDLYVYDYATNTWSEISPAGGVKPPGRTSHAFAYDSTNNVFLLYGGLNASGVLNDTWVYNPSTTTWTQVNSAPTASTTAVYAKMSYDSDHNVFVMAQVGVGGGYYGGAWNTYGIETWLFRYAGGGPNAGTQASTATPPAGALNRYNTGWGKDPALVSSGSSLYVGWSETGSPFDPTDDAWPHIYVSQYSSGNWVPLGTSFDAISSDIFEAHAPSLGLVGGTPWVSYYQTANTGQTAAVYSSSWDGNSTWNGGAVGLVGTGTLFQGQSQIIGVGSVPHVAMLQVDENVYPQRTLAWVMAWNGSAWAVKGGALNQDLSVVNGTGAGDTVLSVSLASNGSNPVAAWSEYVHTANPGDGYDHDTNPQIYVSQWNGSQWVLLGGSLNMSTANGWAYDPSIAYLNGMYYVAWVERTQTGNNQLYVKAWNGSSWALVGSGALNRGATAGWAFHPSLAADSVNSILYLGWVEQVASGDKAQVFLAGYSGGSWSNFGGALNADPVNGSAQRVSIGVWNGEPVAAWGEVNAGATRQVFVAQWKGSSWSLLPGPSVADTTPPTTPPSLTAMSASSTEIDLSWGASADTVGVVGYHVYRDNVLAATVTSTLGFRDTGLAAFSYHCYAVAAFDAAGNVSPQTAASCAGLAISSLSLSSASVTGGVPVTLNTVSLNGPAPALGAVVALSSDNAAAVVPASVTVTGGYTVSPAFTITTTSVTSATMVTISASYGGRTVTATLTVNPSASGSGPEALSLRGIAGEVSGVQNGATVTPSQGPSGFYGTVVNTGGSVTFSNNGDGVSFQSCCGNPGNAYYSFTGTGVGTVFGTATGQVTFTLTSKYSFAQRQSMPPGGQRYAFDVVDGSGVHQFGFMTEAAASPSYLEFVWVVGGNTNFYYVPVGTEDTLFGAGVSMQVTILWTASGAQLYLNGSQASNEATAATAANWNSSSIFDLGAYEYFYMGSDTGGYDSCDDTVADFTVGPAVAVALIAPANQATVSGTVAVTASATAALGVASVQFQLDGSNLGTAVTASPYSINWNTNTVSNGSHTLTATVTANGGATATSSVIAVTVTNPPTVSLTAPAAGTVNGTIAVTASASSGSGIASVQFQLDGNNLGSLVTASPYSINWNTNTVSNGSHTLTAIATANGGGTATSSPVSVTVSNPPTVSLTAPATGATVNGTIAVTASASSGSGIASVQFQLDGSNLGSAVTVSPYSINWNTNAASNGSHTLTAIATANGGATATSSPISVTVNNPPTVSITAPTSGATVSGTTTVTASANSGSGVASVQFQLDGSNLGSAVTSSPYSINWNTTTVLNGSHTLTAIVTAIGGATATSSAVSVTVNNAPMVSITAPTSGATVSGTTTVTASASASGGVASVQFQLDGGNLGSAVTASPYSTNWDTTKVSNGSHTLTAIVTPNSGATVTSSSVTVTVNNVAAPTVTLTAPAAGSTVGGTIAVTASATAGAGVASVQFQLDGSNLGSAVTVSPYSINWNTTAASNASHTLTAIVTANGGATATSSPVTVTVNNLPAVSITAPTTGATVNGTITVTASATAAAGVASVQFQLDGNNLGSAVTVSPYSINWNTNTASNGSHTLTAIATANGGATATSSAVSVTVSNPPAVSITAPAAGTTVNGTITVTASASSGSGIASVQFQLDGNNLGTAVTSSPYSVNWNTNTVGNGSHTLTAIATAIGGATGTSSPVSVTVSNLPTVSITAPTAGATVNGTIAVTASASAGPGIASVQFQLDGNNLGSAVTGVPYSINWNTATASNGSHTLTAIATANGGATATSAAISVTVSNLPTVSLTAPTAGATVSGTTTVTASASAGAGVASVQFQLDGANLGSAVTSVPYSINWNTTAASNGSHTLTAIVTANGGATATSSPITVTVSNASSPTVSVTAPAAGATVSGTTTVTASASAGAGVASVQFQLDGANLGGAITVSPYSINWNTTTASNGSHTLTAIATANGGATATSSPVTVTVNNASAPTVSLTAPTAGATVSGTVAVTASASAGAGVASVQFKLDGSNLGSAVTSSPYSINWNTTAASNGSHTLTAVVTANGGTTATSSPVTVTVNNGVSPPTVSLTAPTAGATVSGTIAVTASAGAGAGVASVQFKLDGSDLGSAVTASPYTINWNTTSVSNGSHTLTATVTANGGATATSSPITVMVGNTLAGPVATALTLSASSILGGNSTTQNTVTLSGTAPGNGATVLLSSSNSAVAQVPASVTVAAGSTVSLAFPITTSGVTSSTQVTITASYGGVMVAANVFIGPPMGGSGELLSVRGIAGEVSGVQNGATVTPTVGPAGFGGAVVNNGGTVTFANSGDGVSFQSCCGNTGNAYYHFTGNGVGTVFNAAAGQISFTLTSKYSFAQRQNTPAGGQRYAFDVVDGSGTHQFSFMTEAFSAPSYLEFTWQAGGNTNIYYVPTGTEDALFGAGVSMQVTILWSATGSQLYLNGALAASQETGPATANWSAGSMFDLGAYEYQTFGGYDSSDDTIADFTVSPPPVCTVSGDGTVGVADIQQMVNEALGASAAGNDINNDGVVNAIDVQIVVNAVLGLGCLR